MAFPELTKASHIASIKVPPATPHGNFPLANWRPPSYAEKFASALAGLQKAIPPGTKTWRARELEDAQLRHLDTMRRQDALLEAEIADQMRRYLEDKRQFDIGIERDDAAILREQDQFDRTMELNWAKLRAQGRAAGAGAAAGETRQFTAGEIMAKNEAEAISRAYIEINDLVAEGVPVAEAHSRAMQNMARHNRYLSAAQLANAASVLMDVTGLSTQFEEQTVEQFIQDALDRRFALAESPEEMVAISRYREGVAGTAEMAIISRILREAAQPKVVPPPALEPSPAPVPVPDYMERVPQQYRTTIQQIIDEFNRRFPPRR